MASLSAVEKEQLAISYAAFVLSGSGAEVNQTTLNAVLAASGAKVSNGLVNAVAKALKGRSVSSFFGSVSSGSGSAPAAESKPAAKEAVKEAPKKKQQKAPEPVEEDADMGGLFD